MSSNQHHLIDRVVARPSQAEVILLIICRKDTITIHSVVSSKLKTNIPPVQRTPSVKCYAVNSTTTFSQQNTCKILISLYEKHERSLELSANMLSNLLFCGLLGSIRVFSWDQQRLNWPELNTAALSLRGSGQSSVCFCYLSRARPAPTTSHRGDECGSD